MDRTDARELHPQGPAPVEAQGQLDRLPHVHPDHTDGPAAADDLDGRFERRGAAHRLDDDVGASSFGQLGHRHLRIALLHVDGNGADLFRQHQPVGFHVQRQNFLRAVHRRRLDAEEADRPRSNHRHRIAGLDARHGRPVIPRGEVVADEERPLIIHAFGDGQEVDVGSRHPDLLCLRAAQGPTERPDPQGPEVLAQRRLAVETEPTAAAHDVEGHHDPVSGPEALDPGPYGLDHPDALVPHRLSR